MRQREGSVLILALWSLFFLAALALAVGSHVSAGIRLASHARVNTTAYYLARAGIERAVREAIDNTTNWDGLVVGELGSDETLFRDVDALPGGTFSVYYPYVATNTGEIATNYGIVRELFKIDLNTPNAQERERLRSLAGRDTADAILRGPEGVEKKGLADRESEAYSYETLQELLLVSDVSYDLFLEIEPLVTVYGGSCYGGMAEGKATVDDGAGGRRTLAICRIVFVFDKDSREVRYWHEH
ncbi:hypothetical protein ACFLSJ_05415 [Verrucomicrobiota bacterium]